VDLLIRNIRTISATQAQQLKQALAKFDARTHLWRDDA
jgi:hypothetical protein